MSLSTLNTSMESPNNVTVIVLEDEASERLLEASCGKHGNNRKKSIWKRLFRGSERSARSLSSRTAATSSSSNPAYPRNLSFSGHDSVLSCDDESDDELMLSNESFTMLAEETESAHLPEPALEEAAPEAGDSIDCIEVCACNSFFTVDDDEEAPPSEPLSPESQSIDVSILLEDAQEAAWAGENRRSLDTYQEVLSRQDLDFTPIQMANLCYACTRLSYQLHEPETALHYAERELAYTLKISKGRPTMAVSKCYHELARISRDGLGESGRALKFYKKALRIEDQVYRSITAEGTTKTSQAQEVLQHIQETKGCIGRILFEQGKVREAVRML